MIGEGVMEVMLPAEARESGRKWPRICSKRGITPAVTDD
jgi:hypothetical protein